MEGEMMDGAAPVRFPVQMAATVCAGDCEICSLVNVVCHEMCLLALTAVYCDSLSESILL